MTSSSPERPGQNARSLTDTVAETGPGIPDDAVLEGELGPGELGGRTADAEAEALVRSGGAPRPNPATSEPLDEAQAEAEVEAHPS